MPLWCGWKTAPAIRSDTLTAAEVVRNEDGLRVTAVLRTLLDVGRFVDADTWSSRSSMHYAVSTVVAPTSGTSRFCTNSTPRPKSAESRAVFASSWLGGEGSDRPEATPKRFWGRGCERSAPTGGCARRPSWCSARLDRPECGDDGSFFRTSPTSNVAYSLRSTDDSAMTATPTWIETIVAKIS